ncbi:required for respiratory growth protein 9, mitochondrial [Diutina catenulata]
MLRSLLGPLRLNKTAPSTLSVRFYTPKNKNGGTPAPKPSQKLPKSAPTWAKRDASLKKRYGEWNPTRKLSRQQMDDLRSLSVQMPHLKTVDLAQYFGVSPEAVRRILKSSWQPTESDTTELQAREQRRREERKQRRESATTERVPRASPKTVHIDELAPPPTKKITLGANGTVRRGKGKPKSSRGGPRRPRAMSLGDFIE